MSLRLHRAPWVSKVCGCPLTSDGISAGRMAGLVLALLLSPPWPSASSSVKGVSQPPRQIPVRIHDSTGQWHTVGVPLAPCPSSYLHRTSRVSGQRKQNGPAPQQRPHLPAPRSLPHSGITLTELPFAVGPVLQSGFCFPTEPQKIVRCFLLR